MRETNDGWEGYYSGLYQVPERLRKPVPFVVEALPLLKEHGVRDVLDLGCGMGRHCIYLAKNGFNAIGVDLSREALRMAEAWSRAEKAPNILLLRAPMTNLPFGGQCFQCVISVSVLHHAVRTDIECAIREIHRVLEDDGLFLANFLSIKDIRYGSGQKVEEGTFRVFEDFEEKRFEGIHHFSSNLEVADFLRAFRNVNIEPIQSGKDQRNHYWKVTAIK